jgi:hypothetical protein
MSQSKTTSMSGVRRAASVIAPGRHPVCPAASLHPSEAAAQQPAPAGGKGMNKGLGNSKAEVPTKVLHQPAGCEPGAAVHVR